MKVKSQGLLFGAFLFAACVATWIAVHETSFGPQPTSTPPAELEMLASRWTLTHMFKKGKFIGMELPVLLASAKASVLAASNSTFCAVASFASLYNNTDLYVNTSSACQLTSTSSGLAPAGLAIYNGSLNFLNVGSQTVPLQVNGTWAMISSTLSAQTNSSYWGVYQPYVVTLLNATQCNSTSLTVNISGCPTGYKCVSSYNTTRLCQLLLTLTPTAVVPGSTYYLLGLYRDCTLFNWFTFLNSISTFLPSVNSQNLVFGALSCGTTFLTYSCTGFTTANADATCGTIWNAVNNPSSPLYQSIGVFYSTSSPSPLNPQTYAAAFHSTTGSSNNNALLGLIALVGIVPIAGGGYYLATRKKGGEKGESGEPQQKDVEAPVIPVGEQPPPPLPLPRIPPTPASTPSHTPPPTVPASQGIFPTSDVVRA
jgi:hypothetical protein